ncbi:MAG: hypothetical protein HC831_12485 [Chloroflexia bacterium]|nr:hypothetical protein [Chloroflexia bacterium]
MIPWQSVEANGKPAKVNMLIDTEVPDSIETRLKVEMKGMPLAFIASPDGDTIKILNLVGQGNKDRDLITASYIKDDGKEVPVGYLNLKSFEKQEFKVAIVPVDGSFNYNKSSLKTYLDKVYAPAIVSWNVDVLDPLDVTYDEGEANGLNTSRTFFSSFNAEMKNVIKAMEDRNDYDKNTYYLFVMNKAEDENLNGIMPFNSQYGFLFTGNGPSETKLFRTIAHELGHGVFKLRHNFDHKNVEKRSTLNLMDYTTTPETATVLRKFQWDEIISPRAIALGWSEEKYAEKDCETFCDCIELGRIENKPKELEGIKIFYNETAIGNNFETDDRDGLEVLAYKLWCQTGIIINFVEFDDYPQIRSDIEKHWENNFRDSKYNATVYYGRDYFDLMTQEDDKEMGYQIANSCLNIYNISGLDRRVCYIETSLLAAADFYGKTIMQNPHCPYSNNAIHLEVVKEDEDENNQEDEEQEETKEIVKIEAVSTFIDLDGNVTISWKNPNAECQTKLTYLANGHQKIIDLSDTNGEDYEYTIPKNIAGRKAIVNYQISIFKNENEIFSLNTETGNFQGPDRGACPGGDVNIGQIENKDKLNYSWTDENNKEVPELGNPQRGYILFKIQESRVLKLTRKHTVADISITDMALVNTITYPESRCKWSLFAKDNTPPAESGDRIVENGNKIDILEVVKNPKRIDTKKASYDGVEIYVNDGPEYGWEKPTWKINDEDIDDLKGKKKIPQNTNNKKREEKTKISAKNSNETKVVHYIVYEEDEEFIPLSNFNLPANKVCDFFNKVNDWLKKIKLGSPITCYTRSEVYSFNAEKYDSPIVVRDEKGEVSIGLTGGLGAGAPIPVLVLKIDFDGGGGIRYLHDKNIRDDNAQSIFVPNKTLGSEIVFKITLTGGAGASYAGYSLAEAGYKAEGELFFKFSTTKNCAMYIEASMSDIQGYFYRETVFDAAPVKMSDEYLIYDQNDNGIIDQINEPFMKECIISN